MSADTGRPERPASVASSSTETGTHDENEKLAKLDQTDEGLSVRRDRELDDGPGGEEPEDQQLLPHETEKPVPPPKSSFLASLAWMVINTLATIAIVSVLPPKPPPRADLEC